MDLFLGALNLGLVFSFMVVGICLTYRIYNFPDITVEGSFTLGGAVAAVCMVDGMHSVPATALGALAGAGAGLCTGLVHTKLKVNGLLAGIIVMTGLYSVNLHVMEKSNIPLMSANTMVSAINGMNPGMHSELWLFSIFLPGVALFMFLFAMLLKTDLGVTIRATGNNSIMVAANGVNVDAMKIFGIAASNALVALAGALLAQYQGFADIGMGVGVFVFGLASVIIGEAVLKGSEVWKIVTGLFLGALLFRLMVALALYVGLNPIDLKLVTAAFVLGTIVFSRKMRLRPRSVSPKAIAATCLVVAAVGAMFAAPGLKKGLTPPHVDRIAVVLFNEAEILTITRDSLIERLEELGYRDGENTELTVKSANGDMGMLNSIVDELKASKPDVFVTISSQATQAVFNKIKDTPIVFATVANPFILGVGNSDTDHPPHITGAYGTFPAEGMLAVVEKFFEGPATIGEIWNPGLVNTVYHIERFKKALETRPDYKFEGATVASSNEVSQAAAYLAPKIDAFVLVPDVLVFEAFGSIVSVAKKNRIPVFASDVEMLEQGAFVVYGFAYEQSGRQGAELVARILKGERDIPFERYKKIEFGVNLDVAKELGIEVSEEVLQEATRIYENGELRQKETQRSASSPISNAQEKKRVAVFSFANNALLDIAAKGAVDELRRDGFGRQTGLEIAEMNAQGDHSIANAIVKKIRDDKYDYILSISTLALQVVAQQNKSIPHVFCTVTDPVIAGVVTSFHDRPPYLTGIATPQPVDSTFKIMREIFPRAKRVGLVWDPAQANSEYCTLRGREAATLYGFELVEKTVAAVNEVDSAAKSLLSENIDIMWTSGDVTVGATVPGIASLMARRRIPYFTNDPGDEKYGVFAALGADYYDVGIRAAKLLKRLIDGENPADLDIENYVPEYLYLNFELAEKLGIAFPQAVLDRAAAERKP